MSIEIPGEPSIPMIRCFPIEMKRRGVEMRLVVPGQASEIRNDASLVKTISRAMKWWEMLSTGQVSSGSALTASEGYEASYVHRLLPLAMLAPDIVEAIAEGRQPPGLTSTQLIHAAELPLAWTEQRKLLGFGA